MRNIGSLRVDDEGGIVIYVDYRRYYVNKGGVVKPCKGWVEEDVRDVANPEVRKSNIQPQTFKATLQPFPA
jgi:hypothetical protein